MELLVAALMGTDKLETYKDWKGTEEDIKAVSLNYFVCQMRSV